MHTVHMRAHTHWGGGMKGGGEEEGGEGGAGREALLGGVDLLEEV